jgi:hypothetical protein
LAEVNKFLLAKLREVFAPVVAMHEAVLEETRHLKTKPASIHL